MTDEQIIASVDKRMDWKIKVLAKRNYKLSQIAKKNNSVFIAHIEKVLRLYTKDGYLKYKKQITLIADSLPDDESWAEHKDKLKRSTNGVFVYLKGTLEVKDYYTIAEEAGLLEQAIDKLVWERAEEIYPRRKRKKADNKNYTTIQTDTRSVLNDKDFTEFFRQTDKQVKAGEVIVNELPKEEDEEKQTVSIIKFGSYSGSLEKVGGFDKAVFTSVFSLFKAGNVAQTCDMIFRDFTGKKNNDKRVQASEKMKADILQSVRRMGSMWTSVIFDVNDKLKYKKKKKRYEGTLLGVEIITTTINGKLTEDAIIVKGFSPLAKIAEMKGQILTYDKKLLDVPVSATKESIIMREELLRRIENMKKHGQEKIINLADTFKELDYKNKSKVQRARIRDKALKMMDYWVAVEYIGGYEMGKNGKVTSQIIVNPYPPKHIDQA